MVSLSARVGAKAAKGEAKREVSPSWGIGSSSDVRCSILQGEHALEQSRERMHRAQCMVRADGEQHIAPFILSVPQWGRVFL